MAMVPPEIMNAVFALGRANSKVRDGVEWIGTGFFVSVDENVFLITNRHVAELTDCLIVRMRTKEGSLFYLKMPWKMNGMTGGSLYPQKEMDLAGFYVRKEVLQENNLSWSAVPFYESSLFAGWFELSNVGAGSVVYMPGFPASFVSPYTTAPLVRMGCIARADRNEIEKTKNFYLDIENFPGNSGSPIFLCESNKFILIGIIHTHISYIQKQNAGFSKITHTESMGIAKCTPVEFIEEIIHMEIERMGL